MFCRVPGRANLSFWRPVVLKLRLNPSILICLYRRGGTYVIVGREHITLFLVIKALYSVITNLRVLGEVVT